LLVKVGEDFVTYQSRRESMGERERERELVPQRSGRKSVGTHRLTRGFMFSIKGSFLIQKKKQKEPSSASAKYIRFHSSVNLDRKSLRMHHPCIFQPSLSQTRRRRTYLGKLAYRTLWPARGVPKLPGLCVEVCNAGSK